MTAKLTVQVSLPVRRRNPRKLPTGGGRLPRVSRLMALAIRCDGLIRGRVLRDYTDMAMLGKISKPRATQIMNLLNLAPDIQEYLLFLPPTTLPRDALTERHLRTITALVKWNEQRSAFRALTIKTEARDSSEG